MTIHTGGCHCGAVKFEIEAPADIEAKECNCSICNMTGFQHLFVSHQRFNLLSGEDALSTYTFNSGVARHYFCRHCGVKSYYVPRSHPNGLSINVRCLDDSSIKSLVLTPFDGRNWEQNITELSPLSD